jgi:two-component sensor histidine kinase
MSSSLRVPTNVGKVSYTQSDPLCAKLSTRNAAWHAYPRGDGEVRLELLRSGPSVECRVSDNGSSSPKIRPGHGLKIVDELARSLDGRFEQRLGPRGSRSIVIFPLEDAEAQARQTRIHAL